MEELKKIYKEISDICGSENARSYIINYISMKISENSGIKLKYEVPKSNNSRWIAEERLDFENADISNLLGIFYENTLDKVERKENGIFYTPQKVINALLHNSLEKADVIANPFPKVLDPSCGSGYFLVKAYDILKEKFEKNSDFLREKYSDKSFQFEKDGKIFEICGSDYFKPENIHYHIIKNCIFGADTDEIAVRITANSLMLKGTENIDCTPNVIVCNSLVKWEKEENANAELKNFWSARFDYVVGNPPWISLSRKHKKAISTGLLKYYSSNYKGNSYLPNLFEFFVLRSLELIKDGGSFALVLPDRFAQNQQFTHLRKHILSNYNIKYIMFNIKIDGVTADSMGIAAEKAFDISNEILIDDLSESHICSQAQMLQNVDCRIALRPAAVISNDLLCLKDIAETFTGFIGKKGEITREKKEAGQMPVIKGSNISRFAISGNWFYDTSKKNIIGGTRDYDKLAAKEKIVVRKTGKNLIAALDETGIIIEQSLYGIIIQSRSFRPKYILAVLNSAFMQEYYSKFLVTNPNSTPQIKKKDLDSIPIKSCSMERQTEIEKMVDSLQKHYSQEVSEKIDKIISELYKGELQ